MRWRTGLMLPLLTALLVAALPADRAAGQPGKGDPNAAIDALINSTLRDVILRGAPIYNAGEFEGCYRLFEGSLMTIKPLLGHRPNLQREIDRAIIVADRQTPEVHKKAWVLREAMDVVRAETKGETRPEPKTVPTASVGGMITVEKEPLAAGTIYLVGGGRAPSGEIVDGRYLVEQVPVGEYRVVIAEPSNVESKIDANYTAADTTPLRITVADATPITRDLVLKAAEKTPMKAAAGSVQGKVLLDGKPLPMGSITFLSVGLGLKGSAVAPDGTYALTGVKPGVYKVLVYTKDPAAKLDPAFSDSDKTPLRAEVPSDKALTLDWDLKSGPLPTAPAGLERLKEPPVEVVPMATSGTTVSGVVTLAGQPLDGGTIDFVGSVLGKGKRGTLDDTGAYTVAGLAPGDYKVVIRSSDQQGKERVPARFSQMATSVLKVQIKAGPPVMHNFNLIP